MCIIIAKPKGVEMPSRKVIQQSFKNNPDGFGLAYSNEGKMPKIIKGAMTIKEAFRMIKGIPDPLNSNVIMHFRFATKGFITDENCHPFPLSRDIEKLQALRVTTPMAIAHNGVIYSSNSYSSCYGGDDWYSAYNLKAELSDTQEFIRDFLVDIGQAIYNRGVQKLIEDATSSKFSILTPKGIILIGNFTNVNGVHFSNDSWKKANYYAPKKTESAYIKVSNKIKKEAEDKNESAVSKEFTSLPAPRRWKKDKALYVCDMCELPTPEVTYYGGMWMCNACYQQEVKYLETYPAN